MSEIPQVAWRSECELLRGLQVRPIVRHERERWDGLIKAHHYLGLRVLAGKSLRYVAAFRDQWVALIGWQGAALKCGSRDRWIGWSPVLQYQRLHLIANNARFLILPDAHVPNLASRVLALTLERLSDDWRQVHGHPVLLAETFVETPRFTGACYRAANWQVVGQTRGFAKTAAGYVAHGCRKQVLLYPLHRKARDQLCALEPDPSWSHAMQAVTLGNKQMEDLSLRLRALPDCRKPRGLRHPFAAVLTIAIAAKLAGARSYEALAEWAERLTQSQRKRLRCRYNHEQKRFEAPSEATIRRVLQAADADAIDHQLGSWLMQMAGSEEAIAIDGKTLKGARREDGTQVHLLSAFLQTQGVTVAQKEVGVKTNEIPELRDLLAPLDIEGRVVSADAMHTQRETARFLVEDKKAHYIFTVKDNQETVLDDIAALDWESFPPGG